MAAQELNKLTYYCSSVHCSYYSCIQLMKHVIEHKLGYDDAVTNLPAILKSSKTQVLRQMEDYMSIISI